MECEERKRIKALLFDEKTDKLKRKMTSKDVRMIELHVKSCALCQEHMAKIELILNLLLPTAIGGHIKEYGFPTLGISPGQGLPKDKEKLKELVRKWRDSGRT